VSHPLFDRHRATLDRARTDAAFVAGRFRVVQHRFHV
jgi:hypothetical protein